MTIASDTEEVRYEKIVKELKGVGTDFSINDVPVEVKALVANRIEYLNDLNKAVANLVYRINRSNYTNTLLDEKTLLTEKIVSIATQLNDNEVEIEKA